MCKFLTNKKAEKNKKNRTSPAKNRENLRKSMQEIPFSLPATSSFVVIKGSARNKERILGAISRSVSVYKPTVVGGFLYFAVKIKDKAKTFAICDNLCYNIDIYWEIGLKFWLMTAVSRIGLPIGALICICVAMVLSNFIWKIEVVGNLQISDTVIQSLLKENNICVGTRKNIDLNGLAGSLNALDGVEDTVVKIVGTTLKIEVVESVAFQPPNVIPSTQIVSNFDGVVTKIVVRSGTAAVKIGDVVRRGDLIIKGEFVNQAGETVPVIADGEAYGEIAYSEHKVVSTVVVSPVTVSKKRLTSIRLFGIRIGARLPSGYQTVATTKKLWLIPIKITTYDCKKIEMVEQKVSLDDQKTQFVKEIALKYGVVDGTTEINSVALAENIYRLNCYVRATVRLTE